MVKLLLFDFDGTLFDTGPGVTNCVRYALEKLGVHETDENNLKKFIGPPLYDMFRELYGFDDETANHAVELYRERYQPVGFLECTPYEGMIDLVDAVREAGFLASVCTGKPTPTTMKILEHYDLVHHFDYILGSEFDGTRSQKHEVVSDVMRHFGLTEHPEQVRMIGDRKYDVLGAAKCGVKCIGVRFGFPEPGELEAAGAEHVVDTVSELKDYLLNLN